MLVVTLIGCGGGNSNPSTSGLSSSTSSSANSSTSSSTNSSVQSSQSSSSDSPTLVGSFLAGTVEGLHFQTQTQSGLTMESGEYTYTEGETITFSIGGITLGSAVGAPEITPFDFFNTTPPNTEASVRAELNNRNNATNFDQVANIAMLLMSLDNDSNVENGINVHEWHNILADASLDFNHNLYKFQKQQFADFAGEYNVNRNFNITEPLVYIYHALAIEIPAHIEVGTTIDDTNDSVPDGIINGTTSKTYDDHGQIISTSVPNLETQYAYNDNGNRISSIHHFTYYAQYSDYLDTYLYTQDENGMLLTRLAQKEGNGWSTSDRTEKQTYTFDDRYHLLNVLTETDNDLDGIYDSAQESSYTNTYNNNGTLQVQLQENSNNSKERNTYTYSSSGQILTQVQEVDSNGDGVWNRTKTESYAYDSNGFVLSYLTNSNSFSRSTETRYNNDVSGFIIDQLTEASTLDWPIYSTRQIKYTYELKSNGLSHLIFNYNDYDLYY